MTGLLWCFRVSDEWWTKANADDLGLHLHTNAMSSTESQDLEVREYSVCEDNTQVGDFMRWAWSMQSTGDFIRTYEAQAESS
jgi:hypothetical protein